MSDLQESIIHKEPLIDERPQEREKDVEPKPKPPLPDKKQLKKGEQILND